jgi:hypothetical protein
LRARIRNMAGAPRLTRATLAILDVFLGPDDELYALQWKRE